MTTSNRPTIDALLAEAASKITERIKVLGDQGSHGESIYAYLFSTLHDLVSESIDTIAPTDPGLRAQWRLLCRWAIDDTIAAPAMPVVQDESLPTGTIEIRSGNQIIRIINLDDTPC